MESHNIQSGQMIGVFADVDQTPICYGSSEWTGEQFSIAVWGDDTSTLKLMDSNLMIPIMWLSAT